MKHSESITKLAAALVKAHGEIRGVTKDSTNPHFGSRYTSLDATMDMVRPILAKNGLAVVQGATVPETDGGGIKNFSLETMLLHESGEWMSNAVTIPVEKANAQGVGSGLSYARRYGVSALLALSSDEDDDGNGATSAPAKRQPQKGPERVPAPKAEPKPTSKPEAWDGQLPSALAYKLPFKASKLFGTPLGEMAVEDLAKARAWASSQGDEKYAEFIGRADAVLADHKAQQESAA